MANLVVHFEIYGTEPEKLVDFYSKLLGWKFTQFGDNPYWMIETGEGAVKNLEQQPGMGINGGLAQRRGPKPAIDAPVKGAGLVVAVDDVDDVYKRGLELGASSSFEPDNMEGVGRIAYLIDPDGNEIGFLSPSMS